MDRPPPPAVSAPRQLTRPAACGGWCQPRWRLPWVPLIRPSVLLFMALLFAAIAFAELVGGSDVAAGGFVLAGLFAVPAAWILVHPFAIRWRLRGGDHIPVLVEVEAGASPAPGGQRLWNWGTPRLRLQAADGRTWYARPRAGSISAGRAFQIRGNPWLVAGQPPLAPIPGELVRPSWTSGRMGLVLHRPAGAVANPLRKTNLIREELAVGNDPGVCVGLYLRRRLDPGPPSPGAQGAWPASATVGGGVAAGPIGQPAPGTGFGA